MRLTGPIDPTWGGYIQEEDADRLKSFSEYVLQKYGGNLNYLKHTADFISDQISSFLANNPVSIGDVFIAAGVGFQISPSGGRIFLAVIAPETGGVIAEGPKTVSFNQNTHWRTGSGLAGLVGNQLNVGNHPNEWSGWMLYAT